MTIIPRVEFPIQIEPLFNGCQFQMYRRNEFMGSWEVVITTPRDQQWRLMPPITFAPRFMCLLCFFGVMIAILLLLPTLCQINTRQRQCEKNWENGTTYGIPAFIIVLVCLIILWKYRSSLPPETPDDLSLRERY